MGIGDVEMTPPNITIKRQFEFCSHVVSGAPAGEHIAVRKKDCTHWRHGVYVGPLPDREGFHVVYIDAPFIDAPEEATLELREVDCFCEGAQHIVAVGYDIAIPHDVSVAVAMEVYKDVRRGARYSRKHCEQFASMCRTGRSDMHALVAHTLDTLDCSDFFKRGSSPKNFK